MYESITTSANATIQEECKARRLPASQIIHQSSTWDILLERITVAALQAISQRALVHDCSMLAMITMKTSIPEIAAHPATGVYYLTLRLGPEGTPHPGPTHAAIIQNSNAKSGTPNLWWRLPKVPSQQLGGFNGCSVVETDRFRGHPLLCYSTLCY